MEAEMILKEELKRLNRRNDLLEKEENKSQFNNLALEEMIQKNTLAMCEITKVLHQLMIIED